MSGAIDHWPPLIRCRPSPPRDSCPTCRTVRPGGRQRRKPRLHIGDSLRFGQVVGTSGSCARDAGLCDGGHWLGRRRTSNCVHGRRRNKLIVLAVGIVLAGIGIMMIFDQAGGLVGRAGPFRHGVLPSGVGWGVCGIGLVFTVVAVFQLARGCPRLELNDEGILYSRCLQAARALRGANSTVPRSSG